MSNDFKIEGIFPSPVYRTRRELNLDLTEEKEASYTSPFIYFLFMSEMK